MKRTTKRTKSNGISTPLTGVKPTARSRIGNGNALLPSTDGRSVWARIMRDVMDALIAHCGGPDNISETMRATCRRSAALEAELIHLEDSFASTRAEGGEPEMYQLDLYGRLSNTQRRLHEVLGWQRGVHDVTPKRDATPMIIDAIRAGVS